MLSPNKWTSTNNVNNCILHFSQKVMIKYFRTQRTRIFTSKFIGRHPEVNNISFNVIRASGRHRSTTLAPNVNETFRIISEYSIFNPWRKKRSV